MLWGYGRCGGWWWLVGTVLRSAQQQERQQQQSGWSRCSGVRAGLASHRKWLIHAVVAKTCMSYALIVPSIRLPHPACPCSTHTWHVLQGAQGAVAAALAARAAWTLSTSAMAPRLIFRRDGIIAAALGPCSLSPKSNGYSTRPREGQRSWQLGNLSL